MAAQDDAREREMRTLFNLTVPAERGRSDVDAVLQLEGAGIPEDLHGVEVPFELKSSTRGQPNISTVRDFGLHHLEKWRPLHWLFGVYDVVDGEMTLQYCLYGSPARMQPWFDGRSAYIGPDVALAENIPELIGDAQLTEALGPDTEFGYAAAKALMKNQYSRQEYREAADLPGERYSRETMLGMLRERCRYVIKRGATLNNPHISPAYFAEWERIERNHAARLRELVVEALHAGASGRPAS